MTGNTFSNKETGVSSIPARLETLSFTKLLSGDKAEIERLLVSCQSDGFYYLDLRDWNNGEFMRLLDSLNEIMQKWFELPLEEKEKAEALSDAQGLVTTLAILD